MRNVFRKYSLIFLTITWIYSCKHAYEPPAFKTNINLLVVSGFINAEPNGSTTITLSRTQNIGDTGVAVPELNAQVAIEGQGGEIIPLQGQGNGDYLSDPLSLDLSGSYRLKITTSNGRDYLSDFVPVKQTVPIDSLTWKQNNDVTVFVNSHDPQNDTRYYRWDYVETWQYSSALQGIWTVRNDSVILKDVNNQTDSCWRTANSKNIVIGTSLALANDVISEQPVTIIPQNDERISVRYSILVRQYALTKEAYEYRLNLQKNTELMGTIFDPQPLLLISNIHCTTNPNEPVIGFLSASSEQEKRIFISHKEVNNWNFSPVTENCDLQNTGETDYPIFHYPDPSYIPYYFISSGGTVLVRRSCLECTFWGGTNVRPLFW